MGKLKSAARIVLECTLLSCVAGIAMDMVTAHVAVEYFTIHHPKVVESTSPIVMALVWGIGASWWFGAICGGVLAVVNQRRSFPLSVAAVRSRMIAACAVLWAVLMSILASVYVLLGLAPLKRTPTFDHDRRLMAVAVTHMTEYVLGAVALVVVASLVWRAKASGERPETP